MPELTVVLVGIDGLASVERTLRHLEAQTARERIEVIALLPAPEAPPDPPAAGLDLRILAVGPIESVDRVRARAVPAARAPWIAFLEDHAYPEPGWAAAVIAADEPDLVAIGPAFLNANPGSLASWVNLQLAYGPWLAPVDTGRREELPGHNVAYRTEALRALAERHDLELLLARDGGLHDLLRRGGGFLLVSTARVAHVNPSRPGATLELRLLAGRLYAGERARSGGWGAFRRAGYAVGFPLIPLVRWRRDPGRGLERRRRLALAIGYALDAVGQAAGYLFGAGGSRERLERFERDRRRHLVRRDREAMVAAPRARR